MHHLLSEDSNVLKSHITSHRFTHRLKRTLSRSLLALLLLLSVSACSANWKHPIDTAVPKITTSRPGTISIIVKDNRALPSSVSPQQAKNFVGEVHPMFSQAIPILNASGDSVAQDIANALCNGFRAERWNCIAQESQFQGSVQEEIPYIVQDNQVNRVLYVVISRYNTQVQTSAALHYDLDVTIWNGVGRFLSSVGQHGSYPFKTGLNPAETASNISPKALAKILSDILEAKPAQQALRL